KIAGVIINASDQAGGSDGYQGYGYYNHSRDAAKYNSGGGYDNQHRSCKNVKHGDLRPALRVRGRDGRKLRVPPKPISHGAPSNGAPINGVAKVNGMHQSSLNGPSTALLEESEEDADGHS